MKNKPLSVRFSKPKKFSELAELQLEQKTLYKVVVSMFQGNPWFQGFLYVGFLSDSGEPAGYSALLDDCLEMLSVNDREKIRFAAIEEVCKTEGHVQNCSLDYSTKRD